MSEVTGVVHRLQDRISPGYGFTAIIVAYLAKFQPVRVVVAAILFGALILAGREIQPSGVPAMIQGIVLFYADRQPTSCSATASGSRDPARRAATSRLMDLTLVLARPGSPTGTILLFAAIGEIFAERAGVLNLGVEGMMLMGAVAGFSTSPSRPATRGSASSLAMVAGGLARPAPRGRDDPLPGRPGRVRAGADVPRAPGWPGSSARA